MTRTNYNLTKSFRLQKGIARTFGGTQYASRYVNTKVDYITHPKTVNSDWDQGLLFKYTVQTTKSNNREPVDECDLWKEQMNSLQRSNGAVGRSPNSNFFCEKNNFRRRIS